MSAEAKWSYYVASYIKIEPTEGVPIEGHLSMPFLKRNLPEDIDEPEERKRLIPHYYENGLEMKICVNNYRILWTPKTEDWFVHSAVHGEDGQSDSADTTRIRENRRKKFEEKFVSKNKWIDLSTEEEFNQVSKKYRLWVSGNVDSGAEQKKDRALDEDQGMMDA